MGSEVEALGALATAGLAASTLDARAARADAHVAHGTCANCGTLLTGAFCHACGQAGHVHRSVAHIFEEFAHGIWHFDSKAWRTLPLLIFRPGKLTREYVHGKRARYIAPLALFLFTVFLMFFVFGFVGGPDLDGALNGPKGAAAVDAARGAVRDARREVADTQSELTDAKVHPDEAASVPKLQRELVVKQTALALAENALKRAEAMKPAAGAVVGKARTWQESVAEDARAGKFKINSDIPGVDKNLHKALLDPDFALYKIEQKAYKLSFLLVPLSLPTLWLMFFWKRGVRTFDHVVFTLYSLSFMSLLFILIAVLGKFDPLAGTRTSGGDTNFSSGIVGVLLLVPPVHIFAQLKGAYALTTGGALWRAAVLSIASVLTLTLFAVMIVLVGLAD